MRIRLTIEFDTKLTRPMFNELALSVARGCVSAAQMGELVYCATEVVSSAEPPRETMVDRRFKP